MKAKSGKEIRDAMHKNPENWKGIFYFNRKDPRLVVPKFYSQLGWTLNFASPYSYLLIMVIVSIIIAAQYFM